MVEAHFVNTKISEIPLENIHKFSMDFFFWGKVSAVRLEQTWPWDHLMDERIVYNDNLIGLLVKTLKPNLEHVPLSVNIQNQLIDENWF